MKTVVYPGSFDPVTNGHLDIIQRSSKIFDKIIVAVIENQKKSYFFTVEERIKMLRDSIKNINNIEIDSFKGLLIDYVRKKEASAILRSLRALSDFDYEFQMALMNTKLDPQVETIFMMTSIKYSYLSSNIVKEVAAFNGCIKGLVPPAVEEVLKERFS